MSSSGIIRIPAEEYVIYYPPTDQSDSRITLNWSMIAVSNAGMTSLHQLPGRHVVELVSLQKPSTEPS